MLTYDINSFQAIVYTTDIAYSGKQVEALIRAIPPKTAYTNCVLYFKEFTLNLWAPAIKVKTQLSINYQVGNAALPVSLT